MDIFDQTYGWSDIYIVAYYSCLSAIAPDSSKLAEIYVISDYCCRIDNCANSMTNIKSITDFAFRMYL